jgi:hypothetical protein
MAKDAISILSADLGTQDALLQKQRKELAPKISAAQEELKKSGAEKEAVQKKAVEAKEPKYKAYEAAEKAYTEVEPPTLQEPPKSTIRQDPTEQAKETFSSLMAVSMLFGALTRQPMLAAMKNMTNVMQGMKEGNDARIQAETKEFERNYKQAIDSNKVNLDNYKNILEKKKGDISAAKTELEIEANRQGDQVLLAALKHDNLKEAFGILQAQEKAIQVADEKIQGQRIRLEEFRQREADRKELAALKAGATTPKDATPSASGDTDSLAKAVANYSLAPPAPRAKNRDAIMAKVLQINPNYQESDYKNKEVALRNWTNPNGSGFKQLSAFGQLPLHLQTLQELGDAMQNNDIRLLNKVVNTVQTQLGHPEATNYETVKTAVGTEFTKAIAGTAATGKEREEAQNLFNAAKGPEQLKGAIEQAKTLVGGRLSVLKQQYEAGTGRKDFEKLLPEGAQETFKKYVPTLKTKPSDSSGGWTIKEK